MANKESVTIEACASDPIIGSRVGYLVPARDEGVDGWALRVDETLDTRGSGYRPLQALAEMATAGRIRNGPALSISGPIVRVVFDSGHQVHLRPDGMYLSAPGHRISLKDARATEGRWVEYGAESGALTDAVEKLMALEVKASAGAVKQGGNLSDL